MMVGVSIFILAAGAILAFAVDTEVTWIDLVTTGWILMGLGFTVFVWSLFQLAAMVEWERQAAAEEHDRRMTTVPPG